MSTLIKDIVIPDDRHITLDIELPPEVPVGDASITLTIKPAEKREHRLAELFASGKDDEVWMADDFDDPMMQVKEPQPKVATEEILKFAGILAGSKAFEGDSVALIRKIRDEW